MKRNLIWYSAKISVVYEQSYTPNLAFDLICHAYQLPRSYGEEHLDTLASMNHLAGALFHQGKYEQAEEIHHQPLSPKRRLITRD
jgi:hypothetical protein